MYDIYYFIHTNDGDDMKVEYLIRQEREKKGYTTKQLAHLSGISNSHLNYLEKHERRATIEVLCQIAVALNIKPEKLYKIVEKEEG